MFESLKAGEVLTAVSAHEFCQPEHEAGSDRIDAIVALKRAESAAYAAIIKQIGALLDERRKIMTVAHGTSELSVIGEVAMALNISPSAGNTLIGLAIGMQRLPHVAGLFDEGIITPQVARAVALESEHVDQRHLSALDHELTQVLPGLTARKATDAARRLILSIDAQAAHERARSNRADKRVGLAPDKDGVAWLYLRGPAEQLVAAHKSLDQYARQVRASGDPRTVQQIMCDTAIERLTGQATATAATVEVGVVIDIETLALAGSDAAELEGYGPICPDLAQELIAQADQAWIRRLITDPLTGVLITQDTKRRLYDGPIARYVDQRDRRCRQPGCDSKIRHHDHVHDHADGGPTSAANAQGLCVRSHTLKHLPGWKVQTSGQHIVWTTPTGHSYRSSAPEVLPKARLGQLRQ